MQHFKSKAYSMSSRLNPQEILERLISFPTISSQTNLPLIDWVETYLHGHGIQTGRQNHRDQDKAGLFAHVGPMIEGAVVLSGHTDVVPVEGQDWASDPFTLTERDGLLYGRGTCDMKGFDALAIWALVEGHYMGLKRPLQLALTYDEEIGCDGAPPLIAAMADVLPKGATVFVGEPSMMQAVTGHKGSIGYGVHVRGVEVHSSLIDRGVSAVMQGARLIDWANHRNAENAAATPTAMAAAFDPSWSSWHVGTVHGGTADNITAGDCHFDMTVRAVPTDNMDELGKSFEQFASQVRAQMQAIHPDADIVLTPGYVVPSLASETMGEAETIARQITGDNGDHVVSYGTEAGHFQAAGYSVVVCGPGDIAQAHQADEFLSVEQLVAGQAFMESLLEMLQG
jgi:acetylornithine deacetylase